MEDLYLFLFKKIRHNRKSAYFSDTMQMSMRYMAGIAGIMYCVIACKRSDHNPPKDITLQSNPSVYDSTLASKWGADDYGMKSYVLVLLRRGPNRPQDSVKREALQAAHMANINRLAEQGKLLVAGPMEDTGSIRGIYLFDARTIEEAKAWTETDPAIQAGSLIMEMHPWYGSAAMMEIPKLHYRAVKKSF